MNIEHLVLIAEDDTTTRTMLEKILSGWNYKIEIAKDGAEAWTKLQSGRFTIAILDWLMPEIDGVSICRKIREANFDNYIYVILLTVMTKTEDVIFGLDAGADDYIKKPFETGELHSRLRVGERLLALEQSLRTKVNELKESIDEVRQLKELIPICSYCKKVRDDQDYWQQLEDFISVQTGSQFTHGICPDCKEKVINDTIGHSHD